jgi:signal peptidase II
MVCGFLFYWMLKEVNRLKIVCFGLIIGGALGNVIDRIRFGAVLDFLEFHIATYHWPAFNLADSFICVGACILIALEIFKNKK